MNPHAARPAAPSTQTSALRQYLVMLAAGVTLLLLVVIPLGVYKGNERWGWFDSASDRQARCVRQYLEHAHMTGAADPYPCS